MNRGKYSPPREVVIDESIPQRRYRLTKNRAARRAIEDALVEKGRELSGGPFTDNDLFYMDHPYAIRHYGTVNPGRAGLRLPFVNLGVASSYYNGWVADVRIRKENVHITLGNTSSVAEYIEQGTNKMVARPVPQWVLDDIAPEIPEIMIEARLAEFPRVQSVNLKYATSRYPGRGRG